VATAVLVFLLLLQGQLYFAPGVAVVVLVMLVRRQRKAALVVAVTGRRMGRTMLRRRQ